MDNFVPVNRRSEAELINRSRAGDDQSFAILVRLYTPKLYRVVRRMSSDGSEAEAIVQEAFLRAWRALRTWKARHLEDPDASGQPFFSFLVTIALNLGRDRWRKERFLDFGDPETSLEWIPDPQPGPETLVENRETLQALARAVSDLPRPYRMVIALRYDAEMSYEEISQALNLPLNTVRTHLHRAKAALRQVLRKEEVLVAGRERI
jgi:RNA polymerase sigma-70 factor (ECF subfamily)